MDLFLLLNGEFREANFSAKLYKFLLFVTITPPSPTPIIFSDLIEKIPISPIVPTFLLLILPQALH